MDKEILILDLIKRFSKYKNHVVIIINKDYYEIINKLLSNNNDLLNEVKDFINKRIIFIDRYSNELPKLSKNYYSKKDKIVKILKLD